MVVAQKVKNIGKLQADLATSASIVPRLIDALRELQLSFQQMFWPELSVFHFMKRGIWNEWSKYSPMRLMNIVPLLVEEVLLCCRQLRHTILQLLHAGAPAVETSDSKMLMAELYRRIHDTVCVRRCSQSLRTPYSHLTHFAASCMPLSGKASQSTWRTEVRREGATCSFM